MTTPANDRTQVKPDTAIPSTERIFEAVKELRALEQIATRETVAEKLGRPTASGLLNDQGWYFVQSRWRHYGARAPQEIDRQVVSRLLPAR